MVTIANLIAAQGKARAARAALLALAPDSPTERRALARALRTDRTYGRCLQAYLTQNGMGKGVFARIEAAREALAARDAAA